MSEKSGLDDARAALAEREARYRNLIDSMDNGYCVVEVIFDQEGAPIDYTFIETNPAFEQQTGLVDATGKGMRFLAPDHEEFWFDTYARIATTGTAERFEHRAEALNRWFNVFAFRVDDPQDHHIAILFEDISERKRAQRDLLHANQLLRTTFDNSLEIVQLFKAVRDEDGAIVDFEWLLTNRQWNDRWGPRAGRRLLKENPAVVESGIWDMFLQVMELGNPITHEHYYKYEQFDGWFFQTIAKADDGILLATIDISDRKRAEIALRESEEKYRTLFETIDEGICVIELIEATASKAADFRYVEVNASHGRQSGLGDVTGKLGSEVVPGAETYWYETYDEIIRTGESKRIEGYNQDTDRWYTAFASRVGGPESRLVCVVSEDITERKKAEAALQESRTLLARTLDALPMGIGILDRDGVVRRLNPQMEYFLPNAIIPSREPGRVARWQGWDAHGKPVTPENFPSARALRGEKVVPGVEMLYSDDDGHELWTQVSSVPLQDEDGAVTGAISIVSNIDALKRSQEALRESEDRQVFLLELSDALRAETTVEAVGHRAVEMIAARLGADRVYLVTLTPGDDNIIVTHEIKRADLPPLKGSYRGSDFPSALKELFDHPIVYRDVRTDPRLGDLERMAFGGLGAVGFMAVPIRRGDATIIWAAGAVSREPRSWTPDEIALFHEAVDRSWAAIERARVEGELRESERTLRIALEAGRMGTYRYDVRTGSEQWSDTAYEMLGLTKTAEAPTREEFLALVHPDDLDRVEFGLDDERPEGTPLTTEFRIVRPDGAVRWILAYALALFGPDGKPAELIGVNIDVTEQRRLEAAMHSSEERLREFGEASSDVMWIRRASDLQWEYLSPAFHKIYGISRQDALRGDNYLSWQELIVPEDRETALANIDAVRRGERATFEYRIRRPEDGQIRWLRNTDFPMRDEAGKLIRIGGIGHDITPLKQAEEHQKLLTAELQHRVRNTLAVIRSIARRTAATSESVDEFAMNLEGRIDTFARVQSVVTRDPSAGVDLATLVAEELRAASVREGAALTVDGPDLRLRAKPAETFALGIHELVTNAIKHGAIQDDGGQISVSWSHQEGRIRFRWKETGVNVQGSSTRRGLGTEILKRTLPYDLRGRARFELESSGLLYELDLPDTLLTPDN